MGSVSNRVRRSTPRTVTVCLFAETAWGRRISARLVSQTGAGAIAQKAPSASSDVPPFQAKAGTTNVGSCGFCPRTQGSVAPSWQMVNGSVSTLGRRGASARRRKSGTKTAVGLERSLRAVIGAPASRHLDRFMRVPFRRLARDGTAVPSPSFADPCPLG